MASRLVLLGLLASTVLACSGATSSTGSETPRDRAAATEAETAASGPAGAPTETAAPPALPAEIRARVHLPGPAADDHLFVTVSLDGLPWTITGCVTGPHGGCEETGRIELTDADRTALVTALGEVRAIPRCEPEGNFPGDRPYRLDITGAPRPYEGSLPSDPTQIDTRNAGPCRADARLAWWIVQRFGAR
jgi:hypothetical protein